MSEERFGIQATFEVVAFLRSELAYEQAIENARLKTEKFARDSAAATKRAATQQQQSLRTMRAGWLKVAAVLAVVTAALKKLYRDMEEGAKIARTQRMFVAISGGAIQAARDIARRH